MRTLLRPALLAAGLLALFVVVPQSSQATVQHTATYSYGSDARQALDAYWNDPDTGTTQPGIVIIHGGYWYSGDKHDWVSTAQWYTEQGFAVFAINHRFNHEAAWPGPRDDVFSAINWIKTHASDFGLDPARIAVIGSQGGGQLAAQAGTYDAGSARVRGVVSLSGINSPKRAYDEAQTTAATFSRRKIRDNTVTLARCTPALSDAACLSVYDDMTSGSHASADDAPMLLIHSSGDAVPGTHDTDLSTALTSAGDTDVTVKTVSGSSSGGSLLSDTAVRDQTLTWIKNHTTAVTATSANTGDATTDAPGVTPASTSPDDGAATMAQPGQTATAAATGTRIEQTYAYGTDPRQQLDAYYYDRTTKRPALVLIHGGYWYEGDKSEWTTQARYFADQGYAVFSMNYRFAQDKAWVAQRNDVMSVLSWIRSHTGTFDVDPNRIVALGSSAGGHLAVSVGVYGSGKSNFKAVAALSPVANPYSAYQAGQASGASSKRRKLRDTAILIGRCTPDKGDTDCWNRWVNLVAFQHATSTDAPMYLVNSSGDFVPPSQSSELCDHLKTHSVSCSTLVVSGSGHGTPLLDVSGVRSKVLAWLEAHD